MPSDFDKLLELSCFKKELLRFFFKEIEHVEYAPIIGEKILYCASENFSKKNKSTQPSKILQAKRTRDIFGRLLCLAITKQIDIKRIFADPLVPELPFVAW